MVWGLLELLQADGDAAWLDWALALQARQDELFWDEAGGGWFSTTGDDPSVLLRLKEDYDGAEPAAGSVAALNALAIAHLTGAEDARARAARALARFGPRLGAVARAVPLSARALSAWHAGPTQVVVVGEPGRGRLPGALAGGERRVPAVRGRAAGPAGAARRTRWPRGCRGSAPMGLRDGRATAYVCRAFACREPVTAPEALAAQLRAGA